MRLFEITNSLPIQCPFQHSLIKSVLYHGTSVAFSKFLRPAHGVYVTPLESWASTHYGQNVVTIYANVTKILNLDVSSKEVDAFYDRDYSAVEQLIIEWSKHGYNCCKFGGESDSMVLFNNIDIVDAYTGQPM